MGLWCAVISSVICAALAIAQAEGESAPAPVTAASPAKDSASLVSDPMRWAHKNPWKAGLVVVAGVVTGGAMDQLGNAKLVAQRATKFVVSICRGFQDTGRTICATFHLIKSAAATALQESFANLLLMLVEFSQLEVMKLAIGQRRAGNFQNAHRRCLRRFGGVKPASGLQKEVGDRVAR